MWQLYSKNREPSVLVIKLNTTCVPLVVFRNVREKGGKEEEMKERVNKRKNNVQDDGFLLSFQSMVL